MVFIALNNNNEIIFAYNSSKGKYKCIYCNDNIFYVNKSKNNKIAHFRHNVLCKYSESINNNYDFYINEFHFKWTQYLVKPEYLYRYWNNIDIADIINKDKIRIIIRRQLLTKNYYMNDENIIWILDGELRNGIIKQITYDNNEIKYYFCYNNLYDLKMISSKHKIYIDYGFNQIIEILPENIKYNYCICNIININDFITIYFNDIIYKPVEYINENLKKQELYAYTIIENKIEQYNNEIKIKQISEENKYNLYWKNLKNYIDNYDNLDKSKKIYIRITHELTNNYDSHYQFLYDENYDINFEKLCIDYHICHSDFKFRRSAFVDYIGIYENRSAIHYGEITFKELHNFYTQYCKKIDLEYNKINKLIINKYINKLEYTHNINCINCNILLEILNNDKLNEIIQSHYINKNIMKEFNICETCKQLYNNNCDICENYLVKNYDYKELKFHNNKYYHLDCYNNNITCEICNLENIEFGMHDLCYKIYEILEKKCMSNDVN